MLNRTIASVLLAMSSIAYAGAPDGAVYLDGGESRNGVVLAHGKGKHPTWLVVEPVRKGVNSKLGYHTISLQMPTGYSDWRDYADGFPEAYKAIEEAIAYLKNEKGVSKVYLFGHSMGSRMASAFVSEHPDSGLAGLIVAGCRNNGGRPLACDENLEGVAVPILDIWGGNNGKDARAAAERREMASAVYTQVEISGANHKFEGHEDQLVAAVMDWLTRQK
jgi:pimeloyl-ACP methyl ester carboxylesterase